MIIITAWVAFLASSAMLAVIGGVSGLMLMDKEFTPTFTQRDVYVILGAIAVWLSTGLFIFGL